MSSTTLKRLSALALIIGGIVAIAGIVPSIFGEASPASTLSVVTALMRLIGGMVFVLGIPGVYVGGRNERTGILGLLGLICAFLAIFMAVAFEPILAFILPFLAVKAPALANGDLPPGLFVYLIISNLLLLLGGILWGISVLRAAIAPRWAGAILIVGALISFVGGIVFRPVGDVGTVIFFIGLISLAVGILSQRSAQEEEPHLAPTGARA